MVNSKKMSKSTVAIVLLSLLLVLSLILTATGAWFTANATKEGKGDNDYSFRNNAMSVTFGDYSEDFGKVMRDGKEVSHTDVMPGDTIKGGSIEATFAVAGSNKAYVVVREGDGAWKLLDKTTDASATNLTQVGDKETVSWSVDDVVLTGANYDNTYQGEGVTAAKIGALEIRMCQTENITMAEAFALLTAETFQANKA